MWHRPTRNKRHARSTFIRRAFRAAQRTIERVAVVGDFIAIAFHGVSVIEDAAIVARHDQQRVVRQLEAGERGNNSPTDQSNSSIVSPRTPAPLCPRNRAAGTRGT